MPYQGRHRSNQSHSERDEKPRREVDVAPAKRPLTRTLPSSTSTATTPVQRKESSTTATPAGSGWGGAPLPCDVQSKMEGAFGADFSAVRVHEGPRAGAIGAQAYTQGTDIHFATGQYQPGTQRGQEILGHELAHVVQQSQGRVEANTQAKGLAVNDDAGLEREADDMGARAARGESVGSPSAASGSGGGAVVQALGGKLDKTRTLPRFGGEREFLVELAKRDQAGGRPGQLEKVIRDKNNNNVAKVAFEQALAAAILKEQGLFFGAVQKVSASMLAYLEHRGKLLGDSVEQQLGTLKPKDNSTFGRVIPDLRKVSEEEYGEALANELSSGGNLYAHMQAQAAFMDSIYGADHSVEVEMLVSRAGFLLGEMGIEEAPDPKRFKEEESSVPLGIGGTVPYPETHDYARIRPGHPGASTKKKPRPVDKGGLSEKPSMEIPHEGKFVRGMDNWTAKEMAAFIQDARLVLDMPVSGTGSSGTTAELLNGAVMFGASGDALLQYLLGALCYFISGGSHTFHEVMTIAGQAGVRYRPGNYRGVFPKAFLESESYLHLVESWPEFLGAENKLVEKEDEIEEEGPILLGFQDHLELGEDKLEWPDAIAEFLGKRCHVEPGEITVKANTDGRSGDYVFMITLPSKVKGQTEWVFKMFSNTRLGDNEVLMLEEMKNRGVKTVGHQGVGLVTVDKGKALKPYTAVLMERAKGKSITELLVDRGKIRDAVGEVVEEEEELELIEKDKELYRALTDAVEKTATEMATLHTSDLRSTFKGRDKENPNLEGGKALYRAQAMGKKDKIGQTGAYRDYLGKLDKMQLAPPTFTEEHKFELQEAFKERAEPLAALYLPRAAIHGDANPGNIMYDAESTSVSMIDVSTMDIHLDEDWKGKGVGAADTGRFLQSLMTVHPNAITMEEHAELMEIFRGAYMPVRFSEEDEVRMHELQEERNRLKEENERLGDEEFKQLRNLEVLDKVKDEDQEARDELGAGETLHRMGMSIIALSTAIDELKLEDSKENQRQVTHLMTVLAKILEL